MNLEELLGDAYQEGMSIEDINNALANKNLVDLSTGNYVDTNKHNREIQDLQNQLNKAQQDLKKSTQSANSTSSEQEQLIQSLQEQITNLNIENNKSGANASMSEARSLLDIKNDDSEYTTFIDNVSTLDKDVSNSISTYFGKQIKAAYEKGKQDAVKDNLGAMGKQKGSEGKASKTTDSGEFGKELAKSVMTTNASADYYFKRK